MHFVGVTEFKFLEVNKTCWKLFCIADESTNDSFPRGLHKLTKSHRDNHSRWEFAY